MEVTISKITQLEILIRDWDYYYDYSDDHSIWKKREQTKRNISSMLNKLYSTHRDEIHQIFKHYWEYSYQNWKTYFNVKW